MPERRGVLRGVRRRVRDFRCELRAVGGWFSRVARLLVRAWHSLDRRERRVPESMSSSRFSYGNNPATSATTSFTTTLRLDGRPLRCFGRWALASFVVSKFFITRVGAMVFSCGCFYGFWRT